jgi:SAM-dependent methyltransferase
MTHSGHVANESPTEAYDGPPDYRQVGRHAMFPQTSHDEMARLNFLAQMNRHLATRVMPHVRAAWERRVLPGLIRRDGKPPASRHGVREALLQDRAFQIWSSLRRLTMEQRQEAGRWTAIRQAEALAAQARALTLGAEDRLSLDPHLAIPRYVTAVDHHCMPGSYHSELFPGDVSNAASYDHAIFATTGGLLGRFSDGGGQAVVAWLQRQHADFRPRRILEIGATLGHSLLPIAKAFPDADIVAVDLGAPMLRYGLARARALGVDNVRFIQADGSDLSMFPDQSFDWVQTTMFLHELSSPALKEIFAESYRLLAPGGLVLHVEQPQYDDDMPLFEQAMRDWDAFYNNEPFWSRLHEIDLGGMLCEAGFRPDQIIHGAVTAVVDKSVFPDAADQGHEDFGRKAAWQVIGARK